MGGGYGAGNGYNTKIVSYVSNNLVPGAPNLFLLSFQEVCQQHASALISTMTALGFQYGTQQRST